MNVVSVPSAGLCPHPWCVEHELLDYDGGEVDSTCFGALNESHAFGGGVYVAIMHRGDGKPGVLVAAPDVDRSLWYSPSELRDFAGLLLNAADALDKALSA